jgi:hypothetical protein
MYVFLTSYRLGVLFVTHTDAILFETMDYGKKITIASKPPPGCYLVDITVDDQDNPTLVLIPFKPKSIKCCGSQVFRDAGDKTTHYRILYGRCVPLNMISMIRNVCGGYQWFGFMFPDQAQLMTSKDI